MALRHSTGLKNAALDGGIGAAFDGGTGRIAIYTGSQPATADTAATGTLLATLTLPSDVFAAAASGAITINTIASVVAVASGAAGWCRFYRTGDTVPTSAGTATDRRMDGAVGSEITFDNANIVSGGNVALSSFTYTHG